jgi:hypothetical protein
MGKDSRIKAERRGIRELGPPIGVCAQALTNPPEALVKLGIFTRRQMRRMAQVLLRRPQ